MDEVSLREWREEDAPFVCEACQDAEIQRWIPVIPRPYTMEHALAYVRGEVPGPNQFAIVADGRLVGAIGVNANKTGTGQVGYWCVPEVRGRGIVTSALRLMCRHAHRELGLVRIELLTDVDNRASQRVAEKVGFTREGVLRSYILHPDGNRRDMIMWSLLREEFGVRSRSDDSSPRG